MIKLSEPSQKKLELWIEKFLALQVRERRIVLITTVIIFSVACFVVLVESDFEKTVKNQNQVAEVMQLNETLKFKIESGEQKIAQDPNEPLKRYLSELSMQADQLDSRINELTQALVPPKQMLPLLSELVKKTKQAKLVSLDNKPKEIIKLNQGMSDESSSQIYKHALDLKIVGSYEGVVNYLQVLESLPWQVFIEDLDYKIEKYPQGELILQVYTLSTSEDIIGV